MYVPLTLKRCKHQIEQHLRIYIYMDLNFQKQEGDLEMCLRVSEVFMCVICLQGYQPPQVVTL